MYATPYGTSVKGFHESDAPARPLLRIDPLLLLATLGLVACSIYTIKTATDTDIPGRPYYYVIRQSVYAGVGILFMVLVSRFDYSRLREWRIGLYGLMIATILLVLGMGTAARGSKRWIDFPFFKFQPSELGKVLLILALAPYPNPRYVVVVTDEQGGWGAQTAAPDARRILAALFGIRSEINKVVKGSSRTF